MAYLSVVLNNFYVIIISYIMKNFTIAKAIFVIVAGLIGAYFIINNGVGIKSSGEKSKEDLSGNSAGLTDKNPIQWLNNLVFKNKESKESGGESKIAGIKNELSANKDLSSVNLTELIANSTFNQMKMLDQSENDPFGNLDPQSSESKKFIEEAMAQIGDSSSLLGDYQINDKDLKISSDNSFLKKADYLMATGKIIYNNYANNLYPNPVKILEKLILGNTVDAEKAADIYQNVFNAFLKTETPSDWLDMHKRYLTLLKKLENLYRGLTVFKQDPVKADLLVQMIPDMLRAEAEIQQEYFKKEQEMGIK